MSWCKLLAAGAFAVGLTAATGGFRRPPAGTETPSPAPSPASTKAPTPPTPAAEAIPEPTPQASPPSTEDAPTSPESPAPDPVPPPPPTLPTALGEWAFASASPEELEARIELARGQIPLLERLRDDGVANELHLFQARAELKILRARLAAHVLDLDDEIGLLESRLVARKAEVAVASTEKALGDENYEAMQRFQKTLSGNIPRVSAIDMRTAQAKALMSQSVLDLRKAEQAEIEVKIRQLLRLRRRWARVAERFPPDDPPATDANAKS